jgi:hypothetical protein
MKKLIYITGIVTINIFLVGALMKILHWPGANNVLTAGLGSVILFFLPAASLSAYRDEEDKTMYWVYLSGFVCAVIVLSGALFKVVRWPGADILLRIGVIIPYVLFLPVYLVHHLKQNDHQMKGFLGVMFLLTYIAVFSALLAFRT